MHGRCNNVYCALPRHGCALPLHGHFSNSHVTSWQYIPDLILARGPLHASNIWYQQNISSFCLEPTNLSHKEHHCFGPPFLSLGGLLSTGATLSSSYLFVELGLLIYPFPAFIWWELDQLCIKRNQHTCVK